MGKQWSLYGGVASTATSNKKTTGKSRKKGGGGGGGGGGGDRSHMPSSSSSSSSTFGGCMSAIFHLFDIQHHHLPFHKPSFISESSIKIPQQPNIILKGVEAPRNSLELEEQEPAMVTEEVASSSSSSSKLKQETNFNLPAMREIQIKTKRSRLMEADISSECSSSSPSTKTPSLVARLMGLDLLPENASPRPSLSSPRVSSSSSSKCTTRSLPVTPRISASAAVTRRSTEVNYHHRLSLQTNKENKRRYDENTSEYAKQIAKQVRENISRRIAGADITNSVKKNEHRRDEYLVVLKPKRSSPSPSRSPLPPSATSAIRRGKENTEPIPPSCSPRLRLLDITNNITNNIINKPNYSTISEPIKPTTLVKDKDEVQVVKLMKVQKCKKLASEKYDLRLKKQEEPPVVKKCSSNMKSTPLSTHLVKKVNTTTKFISSSKKEDMASPSSSTTVLPQKQVPLASITQLPSCQSRSYNTNNSNVVRTNGNGVVTGRSVSVSVSVSDYFEYISTILSHSGIEKNTLISISHWYSPSHPLHPSIFQQVEKQQILHPNDVTNRKLIFDVTDELLVEILKPYISLKLWASGHRNSHSHRMYGSELVLTLCEKIGGFPAADCRVLEDIDGLIEGDIDMRRSSAAAFEEEGEELVAEMEREMVDTLVGEVAGIMLHVGWGSRV